MPKSDLSVPPDESGSRNKDSEKQASRTAVTPENSDQFRLLVDSIRDYAIFILNPQGYISTWNLVAEKG